MAPSDRLPQGSRDTPKDFTIVQALRATAQLAARRRQDDPVWDELATRTDGILTGLGIDDQAPPGSVGTGTFDRAQLELDGAARTQLFTTLAALERDPTTDRARSALGHLAAIGGAEA